MFGPAGWLVMNGALARADVPVLLADDRALLYGAGLFETMRLVEGHIIGLHRHHRRLARSMAAWGWPSPPALNTVLDWTRSLADANAVCDGAVRWTVTGGPTIGGLRAAVTTPQHLLTIRARPPRYAPAKLRLTAAGPRPFATHKTTSYLPSLCALMACAADEEPLFIDGEEALEGATTNLFLFEDGGLWTPPLDGRILPGVARSVLIDTARHLGVRVREAPVSLSALRAHPACVTNALRRATPVGEVDGASHPMPRALEALLTHFDTIANGAPG